MDNALYKTISRQWKRPIYQKPLGKKLKYVLAGLSVLKGHIVVDIGCNAGIITHDISKLAKGVIGIESDDHYYRQALVTKQYIENCCFINGSVENFLLSKSWTYDAVFASCVLYHLTKLEINLMVEQMLPQCKVAVFVSREDKKEKKENPYQLNKWRNIDALLQRSGFATTVLNRKANWVTVIGSNTNVR